MPTLDDQFRDRLRAAAPEPGGAVDVFATLTRRRRRRATTRAVGKVGLVAVVLAGTIVGFSALRDAFQADEVPQQTPQPTATETTSLDGELGLGFPVCRVTSMPIVTASGEGTAAVFTRASDEGCPQRGDGFSGVAVDVDGDGVADASAGPLEDCFFLCEAFAAPDVDGDGLSEVVISTQVADGYGLWLYDVPVEPPALDPVVVEDPDGIGSVQTGPFSFAWVGAAAHREDAVCTTHDDAAALEVRSTDVETADATMHTTTLVVTGTTATVVDADTRTITLDEVPGPGNELCGAPLHNSAADFPGSAQGASAETLAGVPFHVCRAMSIPGDFGDHTHAWLFEEEREPGADCRASEGFPHLGIGDETSVAFFSDRFRNFLDSVPPWLFATPNVDGVGPDEIAVGVDRSDTDSFASIVLFGVGLEHDGGRVVEIGLDCGPGCEPSPWIDLGTQGEEIQGAYCGVLSETGTPALIRWWVDQRVEGEAWYLDALDNVLRLGAQSYAAPVDGSYPEDGTVALCGSPTYWPDDFPNGGASP